MIHTIRYYRSIIAHALLVLVAGGNLAASSKHHDQEPVALNVYHVLTELCLPNVIQEIQDERKAQQEKANEYNLKTPMQRLISTFKAEAPGRGCNLQTTFDLFARHLSHASAAHGFMLSKTTMNDIKLFSGDKSKPNMHLMHFIDRTRTVPGYIELAHMLAKPLRTQEELQARQRGIQFLVQHPETLQAIDEMLAKIAAQEGNIFTFYDITQQAVTKYEESSKSLLHDLLGEKNPYIKEHLRLGSTPLLHAVLAWLVSLSANEFFSPQHARYIDSPLGTAMSLTHPLGSFMTPASLYTLRDFYLWYSGRDVTQMSQEDQHTWTGRINFSTLGGFASELAQIWEEQPSEAKMGIGFAVVLYGTFIAFSLGAQAMGEKGFINGWHQLHTFINGVATMTNNAVALGTLIEQQQALAGALPGYKLLKQVAPLKEKGAQELVELLKTSTFKGKASYLSFQGRALAACAMMFDEKEHLVGTMKQLGKLDAMVSIAKLYLEQAQHERAPYCFANFESTSDNRPHLAIDGYWHPFLDQNTVVSNSIELGGNLVAKEMAVTGPNAGGKSTALKSIALAVIMAQSLTIVPARSMSLTPFALINTYLNIPDIEGHASLFQAEMRRCHELLKAIKGLDYGQFNFVIMDEIFTGTNAREGEAAAFGVAKHLTAQCNSVALIATHFKKLTELEEVTGGILKNYKVWVKRLPNGKIKPTYELTPGISDQQIALDLLAQDGFDASILADAYSVLQPMAPVTKPVDQDEFDALMDTSVA